MESNGYKSGREYAINNIWLWECCTLAELSELTYYFAKAGQSGNENAEGMAHALIDVMDQRRKEVA